MQTCKRGLSLVERLIACLTYCHRASSVCPHMSLTIRLTETTLTMDSTCEIYEYIVIFCVTLSAVATYICETISVAILRLGGKNGAKTHTSRNTRTPTWIASNQYTASALRGIIVISIDNSASGRRGFGRSRSSVICADYLNAQSVRYTCLPTSGVAAAAKHSCPLVVSIVIIPPTATTTTTTTTANHKGNQCCLRCVLFPFTPTMLSIATYSIS